MTENRIAKEFNRLPPEEARAALSRCCGASRWVRAMLEARPFVDDEGVLKTADRLWAAMEREDILEAFTHHPRIGADLETVRRRFGKTYDLSASEQSSLLEAEEPVLIALKEANTEYEERFGHIFIVCASGKSAEEMLALIRQRLGNSPSNELAIAAAEQAEITRSRLRGMVL